MNDISSDKGHGREWWQPATSKSGRVYADYNSTTPMLPEVHECLADLQKYCWGNASSIHACGRASRSLLEQARRSIATNLGCDPYQLFFTSGGSEGNNWVLQNLVQQSEWRERGVAISVIEHPSVLRVVDYVAGQGVPRYELPLSREHGWAIDPAELGSTLERRPALFSIMGVNNETGTVLPVSDYARLCREQGILFHCDAIQMVGKLKVDLATLGVDFATFSGHKFYGPKGVGLLYARDPSLIRPLHFGGGQESGMRSGTENIPLIGAMARALEIVHAGKSGNGVDQVTRLRDSLESRLKRKLPGVRVIGEEGRRVGNTSCIYLPGLSPQGLLMSLDLEGIDCSSGSACSSGSLQASHVMSAFGLGKHDEPFAALRFSFGGQTTQEDINHILKVLSESVPRLRKLVVQGRM